MSDNLDAILSTDLPDNAEQTEIGFPVQVQYIDLSKLYMNRIRWHWHVEIEMIVLNHGEAYFLTDDKKIHLRAGQGVLINHNIMHSLQPIDDNTSCSLYSVVFHPSFLFGYGNTVMSSKYLSPIMNSPIMRTIELCEDDPWQEKLLDITNSIIAANLTKKYGYELVIKAHLCSLWTCLLEKIVPENANHNKHHVLSQDEARVKAAILFMEEHYQEQITLDQLADAVHISKSECCRCFKRTLKVTPFEYLMKYRIFRATNMLQKNAPEAHSMSTLAFSVGFNNASYFNKVFRQFLGCTPSEYKKQIKNDPSKDSGSFHEFKIN